MNVPGSRRGSDELFENAFMHSAVGLAVVAPDGAMLRVNSALCSILGYGEQELLSKSFQTIAHPDDLAEDVDPLTTLRARGTESYQIRKRYVRKDGRLIWTLLTVSIVRGTDGLPRYFIGQVQDVSDLVRASEEHMAFFTRSPDLLAVAGTSGFLEQVNDAWEDTLGWKTDEIRATPFIDLVHPDDRQRTIAEAQFTYQGVPTQGFRNRYRCSDGSYRALEWKTRVVSGEGRLYCVVRDVTDQQALQERERASWQERVEAMSARIALEQQRSEVLTESVLRDPLTGIGNRAAFLQALQAAAGRTSSGESALGVLFIDLDRFKQVNDHFGHAAGDEVLRQVAARITGSLRRSDLAARIGGDEFVVLLEQLVNGLEDAHTVAGKIAAAVAKPLLHGSTHVTISCSIGGVVSTITTTAEALLAAADANMYVAKRAGGNAIIIRQHENVTPPVINQDVSRQPPPAAA